VAQGRSAERRASMGRTCSTHPGASASAVPETGDRSSICQNPAWKDAGELRRPPCCSDPCMGRWLPRAKPRSRNFVSPWCPRPSSGVSPPPPFVVSPLRCHRAWRFRSCRGAGDQLYQQISLSGLNFYDVSTHKILVRLELVRMLCVGQALGMWERANFFLVNRVWIFKTPAIDYRNLRNG